MDNRELFIKQLVFKGDQAEYIDISEDEFMRNEDLTVYPIPIARNDVEKGRVQPYIAAFEKVERKKSKARGCVAMFFQGYDEDSREVFRIPEIRNWMQRFVKIKPHLFYFLTDIEANNATMFYCLADLDVEKYQVDPLSGEMQFGLRLQPSAKTLIEKLAASTVAYAKRMKESSAVQFAIGNKLMEQLHYDSLR